MTKITRNLLYIAGLVLMLAIFGCGSSGTSTAKASKANIAIKASTEDGTYVELTEGNLEWVATDLSYSDHLGVSLVKLDSTDEHDSIKIDNLEDNKTYLFRVMAEGSDGNKYGGQKLVTITGDNTPVEITCYPFDGFDGFEGSWVYHKEPQHDTQDTSAEYSYSYSSIEVDDGGAGSFEYSSYNGNSHTSLDYQIFLAPTDKSNIMKIIGLPQSDSAVLETVAEVSGNKLTLKNVPEAGNVTLDRE